MNAVSAPAQPGGAAPPKPRPTRRVLTSLAFQIFIYFGVWWDVIYYVINIMVFVYKGGVPACLGPKGVRAGATGPLLEGLLRGRTLVGPTHRSWPRTAYTACDGMTSEHLGP